MMCGISSTLRPMRSTMPNAAEMSPKTTIFEPVVVVVLTMFDHSNVGRRNS